MKNQLANTNNSFDGDLRGKLIELVKQSASEEKFIQFISLTLECGSKLTNFKAHEIILDLTLAVVDQFGHVDFNYFNQHDSSRPRSSNLLDESPILEESNERRVPDLSSYDGDDEEFDDAFIFPCHVVYDDCHPEPLSDYYREHLKPARSPIQIVKLPKVCEFVIKSAFGQLRDYLEASKTNLDERDPSRRHSACSYEQPSSKTSVSASSSSIGSLEGSEKQTSSEFKSSSNCDHPSEQQATASLSSQLSGIVRLIKKLNKVCLSERRNCRILAKTGILGVVLENIDFLIEQQPDEQHIYLEPLVKFVFTLSDYKISGQNLKQLFKIIKNEETNLNVVLKNLQNLLNHQYRILRNIQPSKSINFPTASRTPEEIEYDRYLANSWHWRLRSKVIENKRRRSRTDSQTQDLKLLSAASQFRLSPPSNENNSPRRGVAVEDSDQVRLAAGADSAESAATRTNSSWLECSLMTPLSNISPLIHNNEVKFCCSLWLSVCGDLLVVESNKLPSAKRRRTAATNRALEAGLESAFHVDWSALNGHWLRLTSRRRLFRRHRNKQLAFGLQPRQRRLSAKIRTRQAYDQEDEERDEREEKARKSDVEVSQGHSRTGRRFKLFHSSLRRHPENSINRSLDKQKQQQQNHHRVRISTKRLQPLVSGSESATMINGAGSSQYGGEGKTVQRMRQHSHEQLIHLVSFAMDSLTIEIWLNVKCMSFYVRSCRVTREGQTDVHDSVTFPSHLEANGSWSNVIVCLEEEGEKQKLKAVNLKLIVNGIHEEQVRLVFSAHRSALTNFALLIGCERSTFGYVWKLSQINLYKNIPDKNMPIYLLGKGPDFWSFTNFRQQSLLPLPDITQRHRRIVYDPKLLLRYSSIDEEQTLNWLTQNIVISYVAHQPEHFLDYSPSMTAAYSIMNPLPADYEFSNSAERFIQAKTLDFSRSIRFNQNNSIGSALVEAGGVESVLVSFAEVVRRSNESLSAHQTHALAFSVLLKMVQTNLYHLNKFLDELNGLKLIEYILAHPKCQVSCEMLESYLDFCLISPSSHHNHHHQRQLIKSPKVIHHLMISWRVWHKEAKVAKLLYRRLIRLLHTTAPQIQRGKHDSDYYHIEHNFRMISQADGIDILMDVLRECLLASDDDDSPDYIDHELIGLIVQLISLLFKQPPGLDVMLDITEFLLFLHPDPKAYVDVGQGRLAFLNQIDQGAIGSIQDYGGERMVFDDEIQNSTGGARTPFSLTPSESEESSPESELRPHERRLGSNNLVSGLSNSRRTNSINSSATDLRNRISRQCSRNLAELVGQYNSRGGTSGTAGGKLRRLPRSPSPSDSGQSAANCSNRNYAIARIADMLHFSIIEPTSASNTLTEALIKSIIDPRKFIILANNELAQVREKVLRLFLYCVRACYTSPDLKSVLVKYEQATESANYKICTPVHLMARQLLKYSTTSKMIQFCHGILVGVSDFEAADTFFASFDIDTNIDQFQLNILVLLIKLITKLPQPREIIAGLRIVQVCMRQLVRLREISTVLVLIKNDLRDCLMSLYFSHVRNMISWALTRQMAPNGTGDHEDGNKLGDDDDDGEQLGPEQCETLVMELDKMLVFIVRFYLQNQPTSEMVKSINELILYLELLNTQVPVQFKWLLRDRMVKLFLTKLRFCAHYETCAKQQASSRRLLPTIVGAIKSLLPNSDSNKFSNVLPEFEPSDLDEDLSENLWPLAACEIDLNNYVKSSGNGTSVDTSDQQVFEGDDDATGSGSDSTVEMEPEEELSERIEISESSVIERFDCTFSMIVNFVTTREPDVIPSPLERRFIIMCLKRLARFLLEQDSYKSPSINEQVRLESNATAKQSAQAATKRWTRILTKLEHSLRTHFTSLILYLLSPTNNGMNLDERKYFAYQILDMFQVDQLLAVLGESPLESEHKILLAFIKDLMDYDETNGAQQGEQTIYEANGSNQSEEEEEEDELLDDTEIKLRELICGLESELSSSAAARAGSKLRLSYKGWFRASVKQDKNHLETTNGGHQDQKRQAIWLDNLAKAREDLRFQVDTFRFKLSAGCGGSCQKQTLAGAGGGGGSLESLTLSSRSMDERGDRFLDEAVRITRDVVNDKHEQRKAYLEDVKQNKIYNYHMRQQWLSLIISHTHERAIWFLEDYYPKSWELNPVEGPSRTRRRLRPCKLKLESRFLRRPAADGNRGEHCVESSSESTPDSNDDDDDDSADWYSLYSPHPLCSLIINNEQSLDSNELRIRMFTTDKIHFNCDCSIIRPNEVCHGEVSIASWCIHFIGNRGDEMDLRTGGSLNMCRHLTKQRLGSVKSSGGSRSANLQKPLDRSQSTNTRNTLTSRAGNQSATSHTISATTRPLVTSTVVEDLWFDEIVEIWDRRYQLQEVGLEIFLTNNMTYLLSFRTSSDREDFKQNLMREQHKMINLQRFNLTSSLTRLTQLWRDGKLTNFDYLTCLNKLAGRSFNDLMQYPVFPFVLSNYASSVLDLNEPENFRNLKRPMAIQNEAREENFKNVYQMSLSSGPTISSFGLSKPYHYGNHYSNSATVLHFLVRLPPFTQMLIEYQDNNFDQPDRTFHAVANTWQLITRDSNTDFKELIPEFFFLPEMFINLGNLELGRKQNNELVDDVKLPAWCPNGDARLFTLIHRQALESAFVSENLHHWIDLIFGYKQTGKPAIEALNVFHPATYYGGVDLSQRTSAAAGSGAGSSSSSATAATDSLSAINLAIAKSSSVNFSAVSSSSELRNSNSNLNAEATNHLVPSEIRNQQAQHSPRRRRLVINKFLQVDIERSALETMIKTYGQMPRQLFSTPMKQRLANLFAQQLNENQLEKHQRQQTTGLGTINQEAKVFLSRKLEPLKQVRGLRWGSYVGSPSDSDVIAVKHKRIILEPVKSDYRIKRNAVAGTNFTLGPKLLSKQSDKFHFCLLPNGDVAILRNNTSLMLDYRADRKSSGTTYQLSIPSARYSRRAGLSRVSRMNLFSNMIISRQQFSFLEPIHAPITTSQFGVDSSGGGTSGQGASSLVASITGGGSGSGGNGSSASARAKFSLDSLNLVSWFYIDGVVRVKHPAPSHQQPSIPLVQANTIVDTMTTCLSVPELNLLLIGYRSGSICAHIVSTVYEMVPLKQKRDSVVVSNEQQQQQQQLSAGPSAIHFLNTTSSGNSRTLDTSLLGPGRVSTDSALDGELYTAVSLAGKTLQSVRSMNKTTRWLYCHEKRVNCIKINVSFGIVVTGSDDGTSVIWDLNSLTFVRTIDYRLSSLNVRKQQNDSFDGDKENSDPNDKSNHHQDAAHKSPPSSFKPRNEHYVYWTYGKAQEQKLQDYLCTCNQRHDDDLFHGEQFRRQRYLKHQSQPGCCFICSSGVNLIAISDTLGDIVTIKQLSNRLAASTGNDPPTSGNQTRNNSRERDQIPSDHRQRSQFMTTMTVGESAELSRSQSTCSSDDSSLTSVIYLHTINGALINFVNCHAQVTAVSYSNAPEGISINVIVVGMVDGLIRLYSSWDLSRVKEFRVSGLESPISDIMYTRDSQLMYIAYEDGQMVVLRNKKKGSVSLPKEWIL